MSIGFKKGPSGKPHKYLFTAGYLNRLTTHFYKEHTVKRNGVSKSKGNRNDFPMLFEAFDEAEESVYHFLCNCSVLQSRRFRIFERCLTDKFSEIWQSAG